MTRSSALRVALAAAAILALPQLAAACPVCFGNADSAMGKGASNGVAFMIGIVAFVQIGFVALFWSFRKRMKQLAAGSDSRRAQAPLRTADGASATPIP